MLILCPARADILKIVLIQGRGSELMSFFYGISQLILPVRLFTVLSRTKEKSSSISKACLFGNIFRPITPKSALLCALLSVGITSCSGESDSSSPIPAAEIQALSWEQGVFRSQSSLANLCELPRSGTDINGNAFPDLPGSDLSEKLFLRSWSDEFYLWYDEIEDVDPEGFSVTQYFDVLQTEELTEQGTRKDNFHFYEPTDEYLERTQGGVVVGYGMRLRFRNDENNNLEVIVAEVEENTPASINGLARGARILQAGEVSLENYDSSQFNQLIDALFPSGPEEVHDFVAVNLNSSERLNFSMSPTSIVQDPVKFVSVVQSNDKQIGYFVFNSFNEVSETELFNAITELNAQTNVDELVIDLRYNGGGLLAISAQLAYMVAGPQNTNDQIFERLVYNDKFPNTNPFTGRSIQPFPFYDTGLGFSLNDNVDLPSLNIDRVFVITTGSTCSASEALINGLRGIDFEVIQIGDTTCGKPYGFIPLNNCGNTYFTVNFQGNNAKGFGEYPNGFSPEQRNSQSAVPLPGCSAEDDLNNALGSTQEDSLATALYYIENDQCPTDTLAEKSSAGNALGGSSQKTRQTSTNDVKALNEMLLKHTEKQRIKIVTE